MVDRARPHYRTVFISDIHLGTRFAQAGALLGFLRSMDCDKLYLVGDISDNWAIKRKWHWRPEHSSVIQAFTDKVRTGTQIVYIPGNHDESFRDFCGQKLGAVHILDEDIHETADGRTYLVLHGDKFDGVVLRAAWLASLGGYAYAATYRVSIVIDRIRRFLGLSYWSLAAFAKKNTGRFVEIAGGFRKAVVRAARDAGADGVICGHIHIPDMSVIDGIHYCNDGDWVENCTALVEHADGRLEIIRWRGPEAAA